MSPPAFLDSSNGQFFPPGFCLFHNTMNSSSSNSNEKNPVLGFNSPALAGSASRPRLVKMRKQTSRSNRGPAGLEFNPFRTSSESASSAVVDDMKKLRIDGDNKSYANATNSKQFESKSAIDELPREISKLNIGDSGQKNFSNAAVELQSEMSKMNLKGPGDVDNLKTFVFGKKRDDDNAFQSQSSNVHTTPIFGNMDRSGKKVEFTFTSKLNNMGATHVEFKTPNPMGNLFSNKESGKHPSSLKKKKLKLKKPMATTPKPKPEFVFPQTSSPSEAYSPMDASPYNEILADSCSRETSTSLEDACQSNDQSNVSNESHVMNSTVTTYEDLVGATRGLDISDSDGKCSSARTEVSETESFKSAAENLETSSDTFVTALDSEVSSTATSRSQERAGTRLFSFASKLENIRTDTFTFGASSSPKSRPHKKKHRLKTGHETYSSTSDVKNTYVSSTSSSTEFLSKSGNPSVLSPSKSNDNSKPVNEQDSKGENVAKASASNAAQEACEKWRMRGNQAYSNGDLAKAEDYYTQGLNSVSQSEKSRSCLRALMLCYSNRAATRFSLGRVREALKDCLMAAAIDPNFLKVQVRAAHCYLAIGEIENAKLQFMKCLQSGSDICVDRKLLVEASDGLEKAQKVSECIKQYMDLLQRGTSKDLERALRVVDEALQISIYSEKLLQMKAETLLMLRRYEQVIKLCEQPPSSPGMETSKSSSSRLWRPCLIVKSYFYLGLLEEALKFIKNQESSGHIAERLGCMSLESAIPLVETIRELLSCKAAGNEAFKSGRHAEAVEHYTAALSCSVESRPFAAVCYCNRAAAYRALGQITDAIADCSLSIALHPNYLKAISRRASLYESIRDYGQAAADLRRLVALFTDEKGSLSELRQTRIRLSNVEEESRKEVPLNMYLILGVDSTASASEIKKAYRKAALKYHPDKAALSLSRSEIGDDGLWKEIAENVHKDADRLFKMIGEAYAVLSNTSKRSRYDLDEEMRNESNRFSRSRDGVFEASGNRRQWQDSWRPYVNTQSKGGGRYSRFP